MFIAFMIGLLVLCFAWSILGTLFKLLFSGIGWIIKKIFLGIALLIRFIYRKIRAKIYAWLHPDEGLYYIDFTPRNRKGLSNIKYKTMII